MAKKITITRDLLGKNPTEATMNRMVELLQAETGYDVTVGDTLKGNEFNPTDRVTKFDIQWMTCLKKLVAEGYTTYDEVFESLICDEPRKRAGA